jgi:hypothetical protein
MSRTIVRDNRRSVIRGCAEDWHRAHGLPFDLASKTTGNRYKNFRGGDLETLRIVRTYAPNYVFWMANTKPTKDEALSIAEEAYIFGYPLVLMDITRSAMTAVPKASAHRAPMNQFIHMEAFPDPSMTDVVSPNADTLYSSAWLDVSLEPIVLSLPEMENRYYLMPMLDAWTNVFTSPGTRTTGSDKQDFAISGPGWKGKLPQGLHPMPAPTNMVWIIGRTQTNGKADYPAVHAIQKQYKLTPLTAWGNSYNSPENVQVEKQVDTKTPPVEQVARMDAVTFFGRLNALLKTQPPTAADAAAMKRFAMIGIAPGAAFDIRKFDLEIVEGLNQSINNARAKMNEELKAGLGTKVNGWDVMTNLGRYGTNYLLRAAVAMFGLGANLPEDAIYPRAATDTDGQPLSGANRYTIEFPQSQLPPVGAFWSVTAYNSKQFFEENPINRYAIGDRNKLKTNRDGSLTLYIQHESPGADKESNWLPVQKDEFNLVMRLYWPKKEIIDGAWQMPPIKREGAKPKSEAA